MPTASEKEGIPDEVSVKELAREPGRPRKVWRHQANIFWKKYHEDNSCGCLIMRKFLLFRTTSASGFITAVGRGYLYDVLRMI